MVDPEIETRLRWHAGLGVAPRDVPMASIANSTGPAGHGAGLSAAMDDFLEAMSRLNLALNGPVPSEDARGIDDLPRGIVYAVAEADRMLREHLTRESDDRREVESAVWMLETAWRAVLAGDIDDLGRHLVEESATRG